MLQRDRIGKRKTSLQPYQLYSATRQSQTHYLLIQVILKHLHKPLEDQLFANAINQIEGLLIELFRKKTLLHHNKIVCIARVHYSTRFTPYQGHTRAPFPLYRLPTNSHSKKTLLSSATDPQAAQKF